MARPKRLSTFDYLGLHRYFLTCCVQDRRSVFVDDDTVALVRSHFLEQARRVRLRNSCRLLHAGPPASPGRSDDGQLRVAPIRRPRKTTRGVRFLEAVRIPAVAGGLSRPSAAKRRGHASGHSLHHRESCARRSCRRSEGLSVLGIGYMDAGGVAGFHRDRRAALKGRPTNPELAALKGRPTSDGSPKGPPHVSNAAALKGRPTIRPTDRDRRRVCPFADPASPRRR